MTNPGGPSADNAALDDFTYGIPHLYEQTDSRMSFSWQWLTAISPSLSGGSEKYTATVGATAYIPFNGGKLEWRTKVSPYRGIAEVSVDGGTPTQVDLYRSWTAYQYKVWDTGDLPTGLHLVKITCTGTKNPLSGGFNVGVDAANVYEQLAWSDRYEETDGRLAYTGHVDARVVLGLLRWSEPAAQFAR